MTGIVQSLIGSFGSAVSAVTDAYFNLVTLLLPGNGTNGAQNNTFLDSSSNNFTITRNGNTTQGTFSPFSQTGWSGFFDGTGDYVTVANNADFQFGTGDFTVEYWVYFTSTLSTTSFFPLACWASNSGYELYYRGSSPAGFAWYYNSSVLTTGFVPAANRWYHVACTRASGTTRVFVDGAIQATLNSDTSNLSPTASLILGAEAATTGTTFPGYISNVRVIKGAAAYTSAFTPSTTNLGIFGSGTTSLLTLQSNRFIDNGSNPKTVTPTNTSIQAFEPFAPGAAYSASTVGGSGYFDGTGDFLGIADSNNFDTNTAFTVEGWVYTGGSGAIFARGGGAASWSTSNGHQFIFSVISGVLRWQFNSSGSPVTMDSAASSVPANSWVYCVVGYNGTTTRLWLNGASAATSTSSYTMPTTRNIVRCGLTAGNDQPYTGYISGLRFTKSDVYGVGNTSITVPTAPPTAITNTQLLLNFTNAGITDATAKNVLETVGNAQISTTQSKFGGGSIAFDGTGDYLTFPASQNFNLTTGDFTIECWFYYSTTPPSGADYDYLWGLGANNTNGLGLYIQGGVPKIWNGSLILTTTGSISATTWYYIAVVRSSGTLTVYLNGTSIGSVSMTSNLSGGASVGFNIARWVNAADVNEFTGYIDDFRITKGFARTITTPTSAFPVQ